MPTFRHGRGNAVLKSSLRSAFVAALLLIAAGAPSAAPRDIATLFAELNALDSPNYTGGLSRRHRALAEDIRTAMTAQFPKVPCPASDPQVSLIGLDENADALKDTGKPIDSNLAALLKAFDHPRQEVRDTAAYTIGLLGPAANAAAPTLGKRFASREGKGNWHNDAYGKLICDNIVPADFRRVIPDALLPPQEPWDDFLRKSAVLMARLYLDPDIEYPPGMMGHTYGNYAIASYAADAVPLLAQILDNDKLSVQKQVEAADALRVLDPEMAKPALPALLRQVNTTNPALRFSVTEALIRASHPAAIPLLIKRVEEGYDHWGWQGALCAFGPAAIAAEDALLNRARRDGVWPSDQRAAYRVLGCIGSRKALPTLLAALAFPDWQTQGSIAIALGQIPNPGDEAIAALENLTHHWSSRVRSAAENALVKHARRPAPPKQSDGAELIEALDVDSFNGAAAIDHGLPWCDERGKVSIDGKSWFRVKWNKRKQEPIPKGFPKDVGQIIRGTRAFLRVEDGWLYGADFGHYGGLFQHVSDNGKVSELDETWHNATQGFVRDNDRILAFGYQLLKSGESGALFIIARNADGAWKAKRIAALPSPADASAKGPNGELLFTDGANTYAWIDDVVPLKCEKTHKGSFFDRRDRR
jgi:HEAT repeat protein